MRRRALCAFFCSFFAVTGLLAQQAASNKTTLNVSSDTVTILRDGYGVPHVFASTTRGLFYGNGYAVAQDRLWQLERYRHDARGAMAELEGKPALARDKETRRLGYTEEENRAAFNSLPPEQRAIYEAYRDGINAWIEQATASGKLPAGYAKLGLKPAPWDVTDSVAIGVAMAHRFGSGGGGELRNLSMMKRFRAKFGDAEAQKVLNDLFWVNDPKSPTTISNDDMKRAGSHEPQHPGFESERGMFDDEFSEPIIAQAQSDIELHETLAYNAAHSLPTKWGSYGWVIAPKRSVSGNALLVGGPQMGWSTPQIAHEIALQGAGFDVIGMGFAGVPAVLIGHNANLAWTTTSGIGDLVDTFVEKLDPADKHRYIFKGKTLDMQCREEVFKIAGGEPDKLEVCRTVHGPVVEWDKTGVAYSVSAAYRGHEMDTMKAMLGFNQAKTVAEFGNYASLIWLSHNFFAADRNGNVGYWHCGKPPLRPAGFDPRFPLPGTGEAEWRGVQPFEQSPQVINPERGYLVNWNNKPAPWTDNVDTPVWGEIFRIHRIQKLIEAEPKLSVESMRKIIADIGLNDANADYFKPRILNAVEKSAVKDPELLMAANYLRYWQNHGEDESVGKSIFDAWLSTVRTVLFQEQLGAILSKSEFNQLLQPSFILHVLDGKDSGVPPKHDWLAGRTADQVMVEALRSAIAELKKKSPQMSDWGFHAPMNTDFKPLPPVPAQNRGTYIQIVELANVIHGVSILAPGQSEDPQSPHNSDQLALSSWWHFKPMVTDRTQLEK